MKLIELLKKLDPQLEIETDEGGNYYIYNYRDVMDRACMEWLFDWIACVDQVDFMFIKKDDMDRLNEYEIIIPDEHLEYQTYTRRPYYRMRGKKVTEEQAFEIIRRTDHYFGGFETREIFMHKDYIGCWNFDNWLINRDHFPFGYGWIHTDGTVGCNAITHKYPNAMSYVGEWLQKLMHFPYLDLMIAVTSWDEIPYWEWDLREAAGNSKYEKYFEAPEYDQDFLNAIEVGIYVHDKTIEIMEPKKAAKKYREYEAKYGDTNREKYRDNYYGENQIAQVDQEYLRRCFERYGIDPETYLGPR